MTHPTWKRAYVAKAVRLRRNLSRKVLAKKLSVPVWKIDDWTRDGRK